MKTWLLVEGSQVLSSCETFQMESVLQIGRETFPGQVFGIASVFTEEGLRGRGYAGAMLQRVHERLVAERSPAHAAILFSEVGASIYERAGYVARGELDEDWVFPSAPSTRLAAKLVPEAELAALLSRVRRPDGVSLLVWPTAEQLDWHLERERFYAEELQRARPLAHGASCDGGVALWTANLRRGRLDVLLLSAATPTDADALLGAARHAAHSAGLDSVHVWNGPMPTGWSCDRSGGHAEHRKGALPMICPLDPRVRPEAWSYVPRALWI
jgi:hypothetical protein